MTKPPKRILMTADTVGGVWSYAVELIREYSRREVEVVLATMGAPLSGDQKQDIAGLNNLHLEESTYKLEWMDDPWADVEQAGEWLLQLEEEFAPEIIHLNGYAHAALEWNAPTLVVGHSCVLSWWKAVRGDALPEKYRRYEQETRAGLQRADLVVAPTKAMLLALQEHYGPLKRTAVLPNGRSLQGYRLQAKHEIIFSAGRLWDEAKNVRALCHAAAGLPWKVMLAGETARPDGCNGTELSNVECVGRLSQQGVAERLAEAAIYALPARYEPFGLSILEAALSGCALVLGDIPSLRENWDGVARFVPSDEPDALREALLELIDHPPRREQMALIAHNRALHFDSSRMAAAYLQTCLDMAAQKKARHEAFVTA